MTSPVARLFGSLANALLDLGLPTIREWLRDRMGPHSDVAQISTADGLVHLDGVCIPIGPRGMLVLERASAAITALGHAGLPELRLHSFVGVLRFGEAGSGFRADVSFTQSSEPEEAAWISGELAIRNASWTAREGSPAPNPMNGHARLYVSSRDWRLEGGRLEGEVFRGAFAGSGTFEAAEPEGEKPLVPPALSAAALRLENGRVGPFLDAMSGLVGQGIAIPSFVPLDAELEGELSWSLEAGGHVDLRLASASISATVQGAVGPSGAGLTGHVDARGRPALILRRTLPEAAMPRDEDAIHVVLDVGGELRRPEIKGTLRSPELGFRLGRPRFVPPIALHDLSGELFLKDDRAVLHATMNARASTLTLDIDTLVRDPAGARGTLRISALDAPFIRDVVRTLGAKLTVPDDTVATADFTLAPGNVVSGTATIATATSKLVLDVPPNGRRRITGKVTARDVVATGVLSGAIVPVEGELDVALDVVTADGAVGLGGAVSSGRLVLEVQRPGPVAYVLEEASARVSLGQHAFSYDELRFRAYGGRFVGRGKIPFVRDRASVPLELELEEGEAEVAEALARLMQPSDVEVRIAREQARPANERWLPCDLTGRGRLVLRGNGALRADLTLATGAGTALVVVLSLVRGRLDGSTVLGDLALADATRSGLLGDAVDASGIVEVDALVSTTTDAGPVVLATVDSSELAITVAEVPFATKGLRALLRFDAGGVMWNRIEAELCGGIVRSSGVHFASGRREARVSFSQVAVHRLPALGGREPSAFVRGFLSGSVIARLDGGLRAGGDVLLDEAALPALDLVRPMLERYGLRPPNEDAVKPVTAGISGTEEGITLCDVKLDLHGALLRGEVTISPSRALAGHGEVVLEEEYLRTSKLLTLPRVLTDRIVLPVRIEGTVDRPHVHASLGESLGRFIRENRVSSFVTSAVEEAQLLLGRELAHEPESERAGGRPPYEKELDAELRQALDAHHSDWELLRQRVAERR